MNNNNKASAAYMLRCAETIKADKNMSIYAIQIMFVEYGRLLLLEQMIRKNK